MKLVLHEGAEQPKPEAVWDELHIWIRPDGIIFQWVPPDMYSLGRWTEVIVKD